jgi:hypothetical protein
VKVGVEEVEGVVLLPVPTLQVLPPTDKMRGEGIRKSTNAKESERRNREI